VAEVLCEAGYHGIFRRIALPDRFAPCAGSAAYLDSLSGLDVASIAGRVAAEIAAHDGRRTTAEAAPQR
jgi:hypothetical protein